jgi:hypothetical protein
MGGNGRALPGVTGRTPLAFCGDGSLLVFRPGEVAARIVRVDPQTGRQTIWKELAPAYRAGLFTIQPIRVASDLRIVRLLGPILADDAVVVSGLR